MVLHGVTRCYNPGVITQRMNLNCPVVVTGPRIQVLIPVSLSVDLETPIGLRAQRSVAFSLLNARSVKNKRFFFLIKDWVVDNNIDIRL